MGFFTKKQIKSETKPLAGASVIPEEFYGTKDPVVHYGQDKKNIKMDRPIKTNGAGFSGIFGFFKSKIFLYILLGVIFVAAIGIITWYYLNQAGLLGLKEEVVEEVVVEEIIIPEVEVQPEEVILEVVEEPEEVEVQPEEVILEVVEEPEVVESLISFEDKIIEFPRIILTNSVDTDNDSLTDIEEENYNTDTGIWDTDSDGYYDGQELGNLYNPSGVAPVKLIDSGLVQEYVNPVWGYRLYYPIAWKEGTVDTEAREVLFSSITGDYVEVLVYKMNEGESFTNWFGRKAEGQFFTDLISFESRFAEQGYKRKDGLVGYFIRGQQIYTLIYHPGVTGYIPYRQTMEMMLQSFRPSKTLIGIPEQAVLPEAPVFDEVEEEAVTST